MKILKRLIILCILNLLYFNVSALSPQSSLVKTSSYSLSEKELYTELSSFDVDNALQVTWEEVLREPSKQTKGPITLNEKNYFDNQKELRIGFLELLLKIKRNEIHSLEEFEQELTRLNRIQLIGFHENSFYIPKSMYLGSVSTPEELSDNLKDYIKKNLTGVFYNSFEIRKENLSKIFSNLQEIVSHKDKSIYEYIDNIFKILMNTYSDNPRSISVFLFNHGSNSFFMNLVNMLLKLKGLRAIHHGYADIQFINSNDLMVDESSFKQDN